VTSARAEWTGVGAALLFHVILIAAMSLSLAKLDSDPEPPSMQVDIVDDVALESMAPQAVSEPASAPPPPSESFPEPVPPQPMAPPPPTPRAVPQPSIKPTPPTPRQPQQRQPQRRAEQRQPQRRAGLGDDFLSKLDDNLAPRGAAKAAAPTFNASAKASVGQLIIRQARRCADRQAYLGEGANTLRLTVNLKFNRSGRLSRSPSILGISGDSDLKAKYGELLEDQVRRIFADCAPFRLPAELYDTGNGGWKDFTFTYRVD
jgi:outer membrane biosynthesis protein TonB